MSSVNRDINEDVQSCDLRRRDRYEATVSIVNEKIASQRPGSVVINTASSVGHVPHDQGLGARTELRENVRYRGGKKKQAFRKLQSNSLRPRRTDTVDRFVNLKSIVGR